MRAVLRADVSHASCGELAVSHGPYMQGKCPSACGCCSTSAPLPRPHTRAADACAAAAARLVRRGGQRGAARAALCRQSRRKQQRWGLERLALATRALASKCVPPGHAACLGAAASAVCTRICRTFRTKKDAGSKRVNLRLRYFRIPRRAVDRTGGGSFHQRMCSVRIMHDAHMSSAGFSGRSSEHCRAPRVLRKRGAPRARFRGAPRAFTSGSTAAGTQPALVFAPRRQLRSAPLRLRRCSVALIKR